MLIKNKKTPARYGDIAIIIASLVILALPQAASADNLGASAKLSTLGIGLELDYILSDQFSIRGQVNTGSIDQDFKENGIAYTSELDLSTMGALLDWRPFSGLFRMTAGGFSNDNKLTGFSHSQDSYEIGDRIYTGKNARIDAIIELGDGFTPYLGLGWDNNSIATRGLIYSFDIGVLFQGAPNVNLNAQGSATDQQTRLPVNLATNPIVQSELAKEERNLESDLSDYDLYPVISLGLGYHF